jgi:hypothetical protein
MEADRRDVPMLTRTEDLARAADFEIAHGDAVAGT